jgi:hypothetical protein
MSYQRPILSRYVDPLEIVWMSTAKRLGLSPIRRNPAIFSMTDGTGLLELGPRDSLDPDDTAAQQIFHEICHWITNGEETFHERDWGFPLTDEGDPREYACLRLQACLAERHGLRGMFGPTGIFREYYDRIPADVLAPMDASDAEAEIVRLAAGAIARAGGPPWKEPVTAALEATRTLKGLVADFLPDYQTDVPDDDLPSLWSR